MGEETDEKPEVKQKKERKIYKGEVKRAGDLAKDMKGIIPVQPMQRTPPGAPDWMRLPPTFMLTKFTPGYRDNVIMRYFDPRSKQTGQMEVAPDFELNVLFGTRGKELDEAFEHTKKHELHKIVHRVACTVGTDPEIFAVDKKGEVLPAWLYMGGKDNPNDYSAYGGQFKGVGYWDGFQAEFTTPPGLTCLENMSQAVRAGLALIAQRAAKKGGRLTNKSVLEVSPQVLSSCKPEHVQFGCSPSKNVYGLKGNIQDGRDVKYRFAGGHIHLGLEDRKEERLTTLVRGLDTVLGVACVSLYASFDNPVRREYYGQPGEYRTPPHGLEYRVLSNAWLMHPLIYNLTFDLARAVCGLADEGFLSAWNASQDETVETILKHDVERARDILRRNAGLFRSVIQMAGGYYNTQPQAAERVWMNGLESAIQNPADFEGNWALGSDDAWYSKLKSFGQCWGRLGAGEKV